MSTPAGTIKSTSSRIYGSTARAIWVSWEVFFGSKDTSANAEQRLAADPREPSDPSGRQHHHGGARSATRRTASTATLPIDYDVTTPKATTLKAQTGSGDVKISNLNSDSLRAERIGRCAGRKYRRQGAAGARGSGSIRAHGVHGEADPADRLGRYRVAGDRGGRRKGADRVRHDSSSAA